jgi:DNA-binding transcriptional MerR regulator
MTTTSPHFNEDGQIELPLTDLFPDPEMNEEVLLMESSMSLPSLDIEVELTTSPLAEELNQASVSIANQLSLPAALCDERLLEEIKSIPNKMGFKIGEVADLLGIKQYVLRYWESEFEVLKPKKANNNQRYFTRKDVENAYLIRKLLHRDRFSIEGARSAMKNLKTFVKKEATKERELDRIQGQVDTIHDRVDDLVLEIRRLKCLFA